MPAMLEETDIAVLEETAKRLFAESWQTFQRSHQEAMNSSRRDSFESSLRIIELSLERERQAISATREAVYLRDVVHQFRTSRQSAQKKPSTVNDL